MRSLKSMLLAGLLSVFAGLAQAADTVTFEDVPVYTSTFQSGGFNFVLAGSSSTVWNTGISNYCSPPCPVNGTKIVIAPYGPSSLTMSKPGLGTFRLDKFDGAGSFNFHLLSGQSGNIPQFIQVTGQRPDGSIVSQSFAIDRATTIGPLLFRTFVFSDDFKEIISATFTAIGSAGGDVTNGFSVDNIQTEVTATLTENLAAAAAPIQALPMGDVMGPAQKTTMQLLLNLVSRYQASPYRSLALAGLNALLARVDGCALRGSPDTIAQGASSIDFVLTCPAQAPIYGPLKAAQTQLMASTMP